MILDNAVETICTRPFAVRSERKPESARDFETYRSSFDNRYYDRPSLIYARAENYRASPALSFLFLFVYFFYYPSGEGKEILRFIISKLNFLEIGICLEARGKLILLFCCSFLRVVQIHFFALRTDFFFFRGGGIIQLFDGRRKILFLD